jgi:hypothetical protein
LDPPLVVGGERREQIRERRELGLECESHCHRVATSPKPSAKTAELGLECGSHCHRVATSPKPSAKTAGGSKMNGFES